MLPVLFCGLNQHQIIENLQSRTKNILKCKFYNIYYIRRLESWSVLRLKIHAIHDSRWPIHSISDRSSGQNFRFSPYGQNLHVRGGGQDILSETHLLPSIDSL